MVITVYLGETFGIIYRSRILSMHALSWIVRLFNGVSKHMQWRMADWLCGDHKVLLPWKSAITKHPTLQHFSVCGAAASRRSIACDHDKQYKERHDFVLRITSMPIKWLLPMGHFILFHVKGLFNATTCCDFMPCFVFCWYRHIRIVSTWITFGRRVISLFLRWV